MHQATHAQWETATMKRFIALLLATCTLAGLAACEQPKDGAKKPGAGHYDQ